MDSYFQLIGFLVFGEAFALYIVIFLLKKGEGEWNVKRNRLYLWSDAVVGLFILAGYYLYEIDWFSVVLILPVVGAVVSHFRRTSEYILKRENPFCSNRALFILNNLKLVLLFGLLFLVLPF